MFTKTALVVDDSFTAQAVLKKLLLQFDYHVDTRNSGDEALNYLTSNKPDVIFLDHIMPGMDGFQVLRTLKNDPKLAHIPVIMYTSQAAKKYTSEAIALGATGVLSKQVNTEVLSQMLDRAEQQLTNQELVMDYGFAEDNLSGLIDSAESIASGINGAQLRHAIQQELDPLLEYQKEQIQSLHTRLENLRHQQDQIEAQANHAARQRLASFFLWLLPALLCVVLYLDNREQEQQITQLNNTLGQQRQQLAIATSKIDDNLQWLQERSKEEYEDLLLMLETLVATAEQKGRIELPSGKSLLATSGADHKAGDSDNFSDNPGDNSDGNESANSDSEPEKDGN